jgi:hypothetical protein
VLKIVNSSNFQGFGIGTVMITGGDTSEQFATLSFRQGITGGDMIEIASINVLNTGYYEIDLPVGLYSLVASTLGFATQTSDLEILESDTPPIEKNLDFPDS